MGKLITELFFVAIVAISINLIAPIIGFEPDHMAAWVAVGMAGSRVFRT